MLYKVWRAIWKEILLLKRDIGGIVIIFLMPLALVITVTLIQDSTFKNLEGAKIPVIVIDNDNGDVSKTVMKGLEESNTFAVASEFKNEDAARDAVFGGKYQIAIVIPKDLSNSINSEINSKVEQVVSSLGVGIEENPNPTTTQKNNPQTINLYFDPAASIGFKNSVKSSISEMIAQIENKKIYAAFQDQLGTDDDISFDKKIVSFKEITMKGDKEILPNSVQHNVPAWALFAIFFIVVPLSINLVKRKKSRNHHPNFSQPNTIFSACFR